MKKKPWSPRRDAIEGVIFVMVVPILGTLIVVTAMAVAFAPVLIPLCIADWLWQMGLGVCHG